MELSQHRSFLPRFSILVMIGFACMMVFSSLLFMEDGSPRGRDVRSYLMEYITSDDNETLSIHSSTVSSSSTTTPRPKPKFVQPLKNIDCARLLRNDTSYIETMLKERPTLRDDIKNPPNMTCEVSYATVSSNLKILAVQAIRSRILPARNARNGYPIAFAKLVFTDYRFLEDQLAVTYAEENWYCFALDKKAPLWFRRYFVILSTCLPNVLLSDEEWNADSNGHYHNFAHLDCLRKLSDKQWNYVVIMQNHDLIIKTNDELATIFKFLNGINDIQLNKCPGHVCQDRLEKNLGKLKLCPKHLNETEAAHCRAQNITWGKGMMQASLTKETVSYVLNDLDVNPLLTQLNNVSYGIDEVLYQTLVFTKVLQLPGGTLPYSCMKWQSVKFTTRHTVWMYGNSWCPSKYIRHAICVRGMEDMAELAGLPQILVNKVMPDFDYGIVSCMAELLFNRSQEIAQNKLQMDFYSKLPMVRFHRERSSKNFNESNFDCYLP